MSSQLQVSGEAKIRDIQGPVVANSGVITALDGAASQYVRGDGTLADFPTSSGGGSSVSYYLNSSVSQGTIGGVAYRELSKEPIIGAGTDIAISANGYVASYLTDANDPDVILIPGGNFNCEFYFSVNNNTGNPFFYAELYKYDGTTFTLLGSSVGVPEYINQGTIIAPYYFAIPVATAALALTDRLAIRIYVNVGGRTVTLHTENGHLCQVVTTLSKGMVSLNNLTDQSQFLTTGTSGTNFAIVSSGDTHTFNLPVASATNTGKLSSTDWSTFNGKVPYTGANANVDLGTYSLFSASVSSNFLYANGVSPVGGYISLKQGDATIINIEGYNNIYANNTKYVLIANAGTTNYKLASFELSGLTNNTERTFTLPDLSGTLALLEGTQTFTGIKTFNLSTINETGIQLKNNIGIVPLVSGYTNLNGLSDGLAITNSAGVSNNLLVPTTTGYSYTFPAASGTIALTSNLSAYVPYTGATGTVNLGIYTLNAGNIDANGISTSGGAIRLKQNGIVNTGPVGYTTLSSAGAGLLNIYFGDTNLYSVELRNNLLTGNRVYNFPNTSGTIALLSGTQTFTGATTFSLDILVNSLTIGKGSGSISGNTAIGVSSLNANTTGNQNTAIGFGTLPVNLTGNGNTAIGYTALSNNTASSNTAIGFAALVSNTTGSNNIAIGNNAGNAITTGSNNTIIGNYAGTAALANNIVLADGQGNIRYQWNGTNNVFGNPISGTSATFSSSVTAGGATAIADALLPIQINAIATTGQAYFASNNAGSYGLLMGYDNANGYARIRNVSNTALTFETNNTEKMRITSGGNVGIGTGSNVSAYGFFGVGGSVTVSSLTGVIAGFSDNVTGTLRLYAQSGVNGINTDQAFAISTGGSTAPSERMRITSAGYLKASNTGTYLGATGSYHEFNSNIANTAVLVIRNTNATPAGPDIYFTASPNNTSQAFLYCADGTEGKFVVWSNGDVDSRTNSYGGWSDIKLKENITDATPKLQDLLKVKIKNYNFIGDDKKQIGVVAQELEEIFPALVSESPDFETDEQTGEKIDLGTTTKSVKYSVFVPMLIKAIQEQQKQIEELKALINK
jgi:hypothetical protein